MIYRAGRCTALAQVEKWLECLHDRRLRTLVLFQKRRCVLEQWLVVCAVRKEMECVHKHLVSQREQLMRATALGDSAATAEILLFEHNKMQPEFKVRPRSEEEQTSGSNKDIAERQY